MPNTVALPHTAAPIRTLIAVTLLAGSVGAMSQTAMVQPYLPSTPQPFEKTWLPGFRYIATPEQADPEDDFKRRPPEQQAVVRNYQAGQYLDAARGGVLLMRKGPVDDRLRLMIANSLAWTGYMDAAVQTYQGVTDPALVGEANTGIASILRWQGKDHLARPIYQNVLDQNPNDKEAAAGLALSERELAPRTTFNFGGLQDANNFHRDAASVNHRWRSDDGWKKYEVDLTGVHDTLPGVDARQTAATLRYQALDLMYKPTLEIGVPTSGGAPFGGVKLLVAEDRVQLDVGEVNWAQMTNNANALQQQLRAAHAGVLARTEVNLGTWMGQADYYSVSDGNVVWTANTRLTGNWQPLGNTIKPFVGAEARQATFYTPSYWSPNTGYGSVYAGLQYGQELAGWILEASGQLGVPVYGEASDSWGASASARRWVTNDVAVGASLWAIGMRRTDQPYSAQSFNVFLEKVWR